MMMNGRPLLLLEQSTQQQNMNEWKFNSVAAKKDILSKIQNKYYEK